MNRDGEVEAGVWGGGESHSGVSLSVVSRSQSPVDLTGPSRRVDREQ